eukprot:401167_1
MFVIPTAYILHDVYPYLLFMQLQTDTIDHCLIYNQYHQYINICILRLIIQCQSCVCHWCSALVYNCRGNSTRHCNIFNSFLSKFIRTTSPPPCASLSGNVSSLFSNSIDLFVTRSSQAFDAYIYHYILLHFYFVSMLCIVML